MTLYLPMASLDAALARSYAEARARGCPEPAGLYWWGWETDGENVCLRVPEEEANSLDRAERAALLTEPPLWLVRRDDAARASLLASAR